MNSKRARYTGTARNRDGKPALIRGMYGWVETTRDRGTEFILPNDDRFTVYADEIEIVVEPLPTVDLPTVVVVCAVIVTMMGVVGYMLWEVGTLWEVGR